MAARLIFCAVIFITCMVCYYNSLQCGFVFDDISAIKDNRDLRPHMPLKNIFFNDFWGTPIHKEQSHKSYRPLCILTFRWNYSLHQLEPMGYHLVNMMLHSIVCLMYFRMCSMFLPEISSFIAAMLFAVHPIHTEAPSSCTQNQLKESELQLRVNDLNYILRSAMSGKGSLHPSWTSDATKRLSVLGATTICLLMIRFDNPASVAPTPVRQLSYNYLISVNLWLLLFPCDLCCDWTMGTVPLVESFIDPRNIATFLSYAILLLLTYVASLAFLILPFLPASNLFFPVGFVVAERILYIPSMGLCMLVAYGWSIMAQKRCKKLAWLSIGFLLLVHGCKTYTRNLDWESEYTIFMAGLKVNQRNAKLFNNVGHALESQGRFHEALQYFQKAVSVQQDDIGAHINVGRTFNHLKMFKEAEDAYLKAKSLLPKAKPGESYQARIAPNHLNVFLNLANLIARNETRLEEADLLYRQAISMRADYTQAYINRGDILLKLNRTKEAQELGVVFLEQGKASQALAYLDKALEFDPEHEQALLNSAILLQELGRAELRKVARERLLKLLRKCYKRILQLDPENIQGLHNLCVVYVERGNLLRAEACLTRAHRLAPNEDYVLRHLNIVQSRINKLQIPRSSEDEVKFEDFEETDDFQRYEDSFDEDNVGGDFEDEFGVDDLDEELGGDLTHNQGHKSTLRKAYLVGKDSSNILIEESSEIKENNLESHKPSGEEHSSPQQTDFLKENIPIPNKQNSHESQNSLPHENKLSSIESPQLNKNHNFNPSSMDPVFSDNPSSESRTRHEKKSQSVVTDSLKQESQRKPLSHNEMTKHTSS
ncbi:Transmembrane and TPR repeat-containing protein [Blattella germanica]|nr:Transmembrane and TPR repeat-containing protein [Blattella germanica]